MFAPLSKIHDFHIFVSNFFIWHSFKFNFYALDSFCCRDEPFFFAELNRSGRKELASGKNPNPKLDLKFYSNLEIKKIL